MREQRRAAAVVAFAHSAEERCHPFLVGVRRAHSESLKSRCEHDCGRRVIAPGLGAGATIGAMPRAMLPTGTVTFLFTDIEGSTGLLSQLGERYDAVLAEHSAILRRAIAEHGGSEVNTEGDAFFAAFPSAPAAVRAAAQAQQHLAAAGWPDDTPIRVRMGLHTGEGRLGGDDYVGMDVHRAARIAGAGHGGQVLLSDATRALVALDLPQGLTLRDLGEHRLKDLTLPVRIAQLDIDELPAEFPALRSIDVRRTNLPDSLTSFVGR